MKTIIEFCQNNFNLGTALIKERLEPNSDFEVIEYGCLGHCIQCRKLPFVMLNGKFLEGENIEELYEEILANKEDQMLDSIYDLLIKTEKNKDEKEKQ